MIIIRNCYTQWIGFKCFMPISIDELKNRYYCIISSLVCSILMSIWCAFSLLHNYHLNSCRNFGLSAVKTKWIIQFELFSDTFKSTIESRTGSDAFIPSTVKNIYYKYASGAEWSKHGANWGEPPGSNGSGKRCDSPVKAPLRALTEVWPTRSECGTY